jgi:hypothetical protein
VLIILAGIFKIFDYKKRRHWIQLHEAWECGVEDIRSRLKDRLLLIFKNYNLSLEYFEFDIPQEQNEEYRDGLVSYTEEQYKFDVLSIVRRTLRSFPTESTVVIYHHDNHHDTKISVLPRDNEYNEKISKMFNIENNFLEDVLPSVEPDKIKEWSIVVKDADGAYTVVSR